MGFFGGRFRQPAAPATSAAPAPAPIDQATDADLRARISTTGGGGVFSGLAGLARKALDAKNRADIQVELDKRATAQASRPYDYSNVQPVRPAGQGSGLINAYLQSNLQNSATPTKVASGGGFLGRLIAPSLNQAEAERVAQGNAAFGTGLRGGLNNTGGFDFTTNTRKNLR